MTFSKKGNIFLFFILTLVLINSSIAQEGRVTPNSSQVPAILHNMSYIENTGEATTHRLPLHMLKGYIPLDQLNNLSRNMNIAGRLKKPVNVTSADIYDRKADAFNARNKTFMGKVRQSGHIPRNVSINIDDLPRVSKTAALTSTPVHNINKSTNYATIQAAIDNASSGDEIHVDNGTYYENVNVNKKLILRGIEMPVVDGSWGESAITLAADGIILEGFIATNADEGINVISNNNSLIGNDANSNYNGISLYYSSNNTLSDNRAFNNWVSGIYLFYSSNNTLRGNDANSNNDVGISLSTSSNNTLIGNNVSNNWNGVYVYSSSKSILNNNIMEENLFNFGLYGSSYSEFDNQIDTTNLVDGKPIYYIKNATDVVYDSYTNAGTFYCISCVNVTLKNLDLRHNSNGIFFWNTTHSKIQNVNVSNNYEGIFLFSSSNNTLIDNNANSNGYCDYDWCSGAGISLSESNNNTLSGNNASNNKDGISLGGNNNILIGNNAKENRNCDFYSSYCFGSGISIYGNNHTLIGNIASNNDYGISLYGNNHTLIGNNASNNNNGISLYSSSKSVLKNNLMNGNPYNFGLYGSYYSDFDNKIDITNLVDGKPVYFIKGAMDTVYDSYTNAGTFYCISCVNVTLKNLDLRHNSNGIFFWNTTHSKIQNVNVSNNYEGIFLYSSSNNTLIGNNANSNGYCDYDWCFGIGISLSDSNNNTLSFNNVSNNNDGISLDGNNNTINGNNASNNIDGISMRGNNNTLIGNEASNNNNNGISLYSSSKSVLKNNLMNGNPYNFGLDGSYYSDFDNKIDITNLVDGKPVYFIKGATNTVYDNYTNAGTFYCISCVNVTLKNLDLRHNSNGIFFWNTTHSKIQNVNVSNNYEGIFLYSSSNNTLIGNNANSNGYCDYDYCFGTGISLFSSTNNRIYHNNLIDNNNQAYDDNINLWDNGYPSGGNYWSDYAGVDLNSGPGQNIPGSDGIGDTPYISDGAAQDRYPLMKKIALIGINVISPKGGENWERGKVHSITWNYTGGTGTNVKIELLKNGVVNRLITSSTSIGSSGSGSYNWLINSIQTPGIDYKIRITSTTNSEFTDTSNNSFTISALTSINLIKNPGFESLTSNWIFNTNGIGTFTVTSPGYESTKAAKLFLDTEGTNIQLYQTGITLEENKRYRLSFSSYSTTGNDMRIILHKHVSPYTVYGLNQTIDIGTNWQNFITEFSTENFTGTVNDVRFRLYIAPYAEAGDTYYFDNVFLEKVSSITVISPNGGENLTRGKTHLINWTSTGSPGTYVKIELLKPGVANKVIISSTPNDGTHPWPILATQTPGNDYKIKITSTTNTGITDISDDNFTIPVPSFTVISPNGTESWIRGTTQTIRWNSSGSPGAYVKIELLKGGVFNRTIIASTPNDGTHPWLIMATQAPGTDYKVKITSTANPSYNDTSDNNFTIPVPSIKVVSPNGSENWTRGTTQTLKWNSTENPKSYVKIELLKPGVANKVIIASTLNDGSHPWLIPANQVPGDDYKIKVTSTANVSINDTSDKNFTIPVPSLTVVSPNGGENWTPGTTQTIKWNSTENPKSYVKIELLKSGVPKGIILSTLNDGSHPWLIPATQILDGDYKIRITSTANVSNNDSSDNNFSIVPPKITVTSPDGNENWITGTFHAITWNYTGNPGTYVKIELLKGGVPNRTILSSTPNDKSQNWTIPAAPGEDYKIRITSTTNLAYNDTSDSNFNISVTTP